MQLNTKFVNFQVYFYIQLEIFRMVIKNGYKNIWSFGKRFSLSKPAFVGSRAAGEVVRALMEKAFVKGEKVTLDFEGIEGITQSFGDEIIGIFIRLKGKDFIKENVSLKNANNNIRIILNIVTKYSSKAVA